MQRQHVVCGGASYIFIGVCIAFLLLITGCGGASTIPGSPTATPGSSGTPVTSQTKAGQVIVQLFRSPGFIYPPVNGIPEWTLYGDGMLVFKLGSELVQAQLSAAEVQHILDVVVNQNDFFASNQSSYGHIIADVGSTLLTVAANGQQKEVRLFGEPTTGEDEQTQHVFAIEHFLLNYRPSSSQVYVPQGIVVLVLVQSGNGSAIAWPYNDIALAQVAKQECSYLQFGTNNCIPETSNKSGVFPIYGKRGVSLWQQWQAGPYTLVSQNNTNYQVIVWPLMPDALLARPDGSHGVMVQGSNAGIWPLLAGAKS